ncbi:hypothetical protein niasHS_015903 [Heterodera schachtii]|uniref:Uncharacterized protein n=2 Tax=Heterodera TaxID=34509 RepID=A0ABD2HQV0_HETSC
MNLKSFSIYFLLPTLFFASVGADWTNFWEGLKNKFTGGGGANSAPMPQQNAFNQPPNGQGQFGPNGFNLNDQQMMAQQQQQPNIGQNAFGQPQQMPPKAEGSGGIFSSMARKLMNFMAKGGKEENNL